MKRICVFAGSRSGRRPQYQDLARRLGYELVDRGLELVFGGGQVGLMGTLADAMLERGGRVIGIIPEALVTREIAHQGVSELRVVRSMHERKAQMSELSDGFIALPGGIGTLEETFEVFTWAQLGIHRKPFGLLDTLDYFSEIMTFLDHAVVEGFFSKEHQSMLLFEKDPKILLDHFQDYRGPKVPRILDPEQA